MRYMLDNAKNKLAAPSKTCIEVESLKEAIEEAKRAAYAFVEAIGKTKPFPDGYILWSGKSVLSPTITSVGATRKVNCPDGLPGSAREIDMRHRSDFIIDIREVLQSAAPLENRKVLVLSGEYSAAVRRALTVYLNDHGYAWDREKGSFVWAPEDPATADAVIAFLDTSEDPDE